ncbi:MULTISPECIES: helix-turn-helix transcriptional regulator [unclassified Nocardia]|uniref:helix-turn-helix domain-containing protein n=1 Tax=unclassified Nocardia TaxID=2637762 RepID=UPI00278BD161|nr:MULTISPECIES: helix-turn-helix transcriptional regulator [unclassified Nocardia]
MEDSSEAFRSHIASNIKAEMARQGITRRRLSQLTGITANTLGRRLRCEYPFTTDEIGTIARVLKVRVEILVARPEAVAS